MEDLLGKALYRLIIRRLISALRMASAVLSPALLIFIAPLYGPAHSASLPRTITDADCIDFINERPGRVRCGFIALPENHDNVTNRAVSLPVLIANTTRSMSQRADRAILIPGGGGPGGSVGFGVNYNPGEYLAPYRSLLDAGYDVVIVDQRGAGFSKPTLRCHETAEAFKHLIVRSRTIDDEIESYQTAISSCLQRLKSNGVDVGAYDSRQSALDFLAVMDALPYDWWGTIATSYATVLAQAMLVVKPQAFDRVVLDSPVPLDFQQPWTQETTYQSVLKTVQRCNSEARCKSRYANLTKKFDDILARARVRPYGIKINIYGDDGIARRKTLIVDDRTLLAILLTAIYSNESIAELPNAIESFHSGLKQSIQSYAEEYWYQSVDPDFADGLSMTVHCKERQNLENNYLRDHPDVGRNLAHASRKLLQAQIDMCKNWNVSDGNTLVPNRLFTTRTMILAGGLDPVISSRDIANAADNFANQQTTIMPKAGHSVWFQNECARRETVSFFNRTHNLHTSFNCNNTLPAFK